MQQANVSRAQVESEMSHVMGILSREMSKSVTDVFDAGVKSGKADAMRQVGYTVDTLKANLTDRTLSDADFRRFVGTVVDQLSQQCAS